MVVPRTRMHMKVQKICSRMVGNLEHYYLEISEILKVDEQPEKGITFANLATL